VTRMHITTQFQGTVIGVSQRNDPKKGAYKIHLTLDQGPHPDGKSEDNPLGCREEWIPKRSMVSMVETGAQAPRVDQMTFTVENWIAWKKKIRDMRNLEAVDA